MSSLMPTLVTEQVPNSVVAVPWNTISKIINYKRGLEEELSGSAVT